jgi:predicted nucleotide-binding protein
VTEGLPRLRVSRARAQEVIDDAIVEATELVERAESNQPYQEWRDDWQRWVTRNTTALRSVFDGPELPAEFEGAATKRIARQIGQSENATFLHTVEAVRRSINVLRSIAERLDYAEGPPEEQVVHRPAPSVDSSKVFVVHGRDVGIRAQVENCLRRLDLEPIVLEAASNQGRTIIEKFEQETIDVAFAVVVMSADDFGKGPDEQGWPTEPNRARQNVILELGYFMGALGRERVAALVSPGVEQPSDVHGIVYIPFGGGWDVLLTRELGAAGLPVDLNKLLG